MQTKSLELVTSEIKMAGDGRKFSGYASVFGGVDSYGDTITPGAYAKTLEGRERPVQLRWNHYGPVIGKWTEIREDEKGLYVEGELTPGHSDAENAYALLKHEAINGLSIGYRVGDSEEKDGIRHLNEIDLIEISVVESPADLAAQVGDVKSAIEHLKTLKEFESFLRDVGGLNAAAAKAYVSCLKSLCLRDVDTEAETSVMAGQAKHYFEQLRRDIKGV